MKPPALLSTLALLGIPFSLAQTEVTANFFNDADGCDDFAGVQCPNLPPGDFCDVSAGGTAAYGSVVFSDDETESATVNGTVYSIQSGDPCRVPIGTNIRQNTCAEALELTITCVSFNFVDADLEMEVAFDESQVPKVVTPASVFFVDGETTYINTTNTDKVDAFWAVLKAGGKAEGLSYIVEHFDFVEQSPAVASVEMANSA